MRKILLLCLIIIILVSINWFRELLANDLGSLDDYRKQALVEQLRSRQSKESSQPQYQKYQTPELFDSLNTSNESVQISADTVVDSNKSQQPEQLSVGAMTPWDALQPFGMELFSGPRGVSPPADIVSDDDYILGPGDHLMVYLWGRVEQQYNLVVDREGTVFIPKAGRLVVWGKRFGQFRIDIKKLLSKAYSDFNLTVSLGKIRSIRIYVTGEVRHPGAYTVSSLTSLFNALYLAGGPTENGSMRSIRLMRLGKVVAEADLYQFLLKGDNSLDTRLESGDAVFVPVAAKRIAIRGEIKRPAIYEIRPDETIGSLIALAGGTTPQAYRERIMLDRIGRKDEWVVRDIDLTDSSSTRGAATLLEDGDRISVFSLFEAKSNMVAVYGQVKHPGYYERTDSTRLSDLLAKGQLQRYDVFMDRANLFRRYSDYRVEVIPVNLRAILHGEADDILLRDHDSLHVYSIKDVSWQHRVVIAGEVNKPGEYPYYEHMNISDLIFLAGSYTRAAWQMQAEIARIGEIGQVSVETVNLGDSAGQATPLHEGDRVFIRQIPQWQRHRTVTLEGQVQYPGEYVLRGNKETLYSLLQRAGGFTPKAFPVGTIFERKSIEKSLDRLRVRESVEKSNKMVVDSTGRLASNTVIDFEANAVNRIVIDMDEILATNGASGDINLEPGDHIIVPTVPSGISVVGAVGHTGTIRFKDNQQVKYYIKRAGNFSRQADNKGTRLIKANGEVLAGGSVLGKKVEIGDVIVVPRRVEKEHNFTRSLTSILTLTTGALTTVLLVTRL